MKRKIAGPAGRLVEMPTSTDKTPPESRRFVDEDIEENDECDVKFFAESAWNQLLESYESEISASYQLSTIGKLKAQMKSIHSYLIEDIINGLCDVKVPILAVIIGNIEQNFDKSYIIKLTDPSGSIISYMNRKCFEQYRNQMVRGSVLLLTNVTIFTRNNRNNSQIHNNRTLIIHQQNINAVFTKLIQSDNDTTPTIPIGTITFEDFDNNEEALQNDDANRENLQIFTQNKRRSID